MRKLRYGEQKSAHGHTAPSGRESTPRRLSPAGPVSLAIVSVCSETLWNHLISVVPLLKTVSDSLIHLFFLHLSVLYLHNYFLSFRPGEEEHKRLAPCSVGSKLGCSDCPSSPPSPAPAGAECLLCILGTQVMSRVRLDKFPAPERPLYS